MLENKGVRPSGNVTCGPCSDRRGEDHRLNAESSASLSIELASSICSESRWAGGDAKFRCSQTCCRAPPLRALPASAFGFVLANHTHALAPRKYVLFAV